MDDLISRQAAIDALYKMLHDCFLADDEELDAVVTTLNDLPSAQEQVILEAADVEVCIIQLAKADWWSWSTIERALEYKQNRWEERTKCE